MFPEASQATSVGRLKLSPGIPAPAAAPGAPPRPAPGLVLWNSAPHQYLRPDTGSAAASESSGRSRRLFRAPLRKLAPAAVHFAVPTRDPSKTECRQPNNILDISSWNLRRQSDFLPFSYLVLQFAADSILTSSGLARKLRSVSGDSGRDAVLDPLIRTTPQATAAFRAVSAFNCSFKLCCNSTIANSVSAICFLMPNILSFFSAI